MALEAGAKSHVGRCNHPCRTAEVLHSSRVGILRASATAKNVEEKSTLMWIMLWSLWGIRAAMDVQIIRGEEGINQFSLIKDLHLNLFAHLQDLLTTATLFHV